MALARPSSSRAVPWWRMVPHAHTLSGPMSMPEMAMASSSSSRVAPRWSGRGRTALRNRSGPRALMVCSTSA